MKCKIKRLFLHESVMYVDKPFCQLLIMYILFKRIYYCYCIENNHKHQVDPLYLVNLPFNENNFHYNYFIPFHNFFSFYYCVILLFIIVSNC